MDEQDKVGIHAYFIGKSGAVYVGNVKLEGVYFAESRQSPDGFNKLCIVFETDKVVDMREKDRTTLFEPDAAELRKTLKQIFG